MIYLLFIISFVIWMFIRFSILMLEYFSISVLTNKGEIGQSFKTTTILKVLFNPLSGKKVNWKLSQPKKLKRLIDSLKGLMNFLGIFSVVALIFSVFQYWIDHTTNIELATSSILKIEQIQHDIRDNIGYFKISTFYKALILFLLIACASSLTILGRMKVKQGFLKYLKVLKFVTIFLTLSTSFTFFGSNLVSKEKQRVDELELHRLNYFSNNSLLYSDIQQEVEQIIIEGILSHEIYNDFLKSTEKIDSNIESSLESEVVEDFNDIVPAHVIVRLPVFVLRKSVDSKYDFFRETNRAASNYDAINNNSRPKRRNGFESFKERNTSWPEKDYSTNQQKSARSKFNTARSATRRTSGFYKKYKEPINVIIKHAYDKSGKKWFSGFLEYVGAENPFLQHILDPLFNNPVKDKITKKVEEIFTKCYTSSTESIKEELSKLSEEASDFVTNNIEKNGKLNQLKSELEKDLKKSTTLHHANERKIRNTINQADYNLNRLCSESKWEAIRKRFESNLFTRKYDFSYDQKISFSEALDEWEAFKNSNKFNWLSKKNVKLEDEFFNFFLHNDRMKACWGFIIQQEDWFQFLDYLKGLKEKGVRTDPYFALKYYCNDLGKDKHFPAICTVEMNNWVGDLCPH